MDVEVPAPSPEEAALPQELFEAAEAGRAGLPEVREAAEACRACDLWARATQTVFGEGPVPARWMLVGEQPGDKEDVAGAPFVGPAGGILDEALGLAGIDRERTFVTNVVKHFRWKPVPGSKRRLHESPNRVQVRACLPWVESELALVRPQALVLMGSTAAQGMLGPAIRVTRDRGHPMDSPLAPLVLVTIHPSSILRSRDRAARAQAMEEFVADLRLAAG